LSELAARAATLERYVAFAFAGADLLVETNGEGRMVFAEGAFQARFGRPAEAFLGRPAASLVAADETFALEGAMAVLRARGRLAPLMVRMADAARTPMLCAGIVRSGGGVALTFGPVPAGLLAPGAPSPPDLLRMAEARLRAGEPGVLTLVSVAGADAEKASPAITDALSASSLAAVAGELAEGRYGVISSTAIDTEAARRSVAEVLTAAGLEGEVEASALKLSATGLSPMQAVRAVRFALGRFVAGGADALSEVGADSGLPGVIAAATQRAAGMRGVISARRFSMAFQPIVSLADRKVRHHEALLRPEGDDLNDPGEFTALAEATGLVEELDMAVVLTVIEAMGRTPRASIAANVSGLSLQSHGFMQGLTRLLSSRKGLSGRLLFELTESAEIEDEAAAAESIATLRARGFAVCIDDFGAGAASFRYIRQFPCDFVKLDGHYIRQMNAPREKAILGSMLDLTRALSCATIAEHVETEAQAGALLDMGVGHGQGWLFGKGGKLPG
jgi:EAL domain-containing protein (putative c-di-GMP-specific phosphodiesterase class I)